jgi:ABC-type enterobactin transport system permease subunit
MADSKPVGLRAVAYTVTLVYGGVIAVLAVLGWTTAVTVAAVIGGLATAAMWTLAVRQGRSAPR